MDQTISEAIIPNTPAKALLDKWPWTYYFPTETSRYMRHVKRIAHEFFEPQLKKKLEKHKRGEDVAALDNLIDEHVNPKSGKTISRGNIDGVARDLITAGETIKNKYFQS